MVEATPLVKLLGVSATFAPDKFIVEACPPMSAGVDHVKKAFRQLLTAAYAQRFGAPRPGQKVFARLRLVKDGFKGEPVQCVAIVGARAA